MKGVRKTSTNCWTAEYSNLKTGRLRVSFNTEKEAIAQRKKWVAEKASWEKPRSLGVFKTEQEALEAKQNYVKTVIEPQIKKLQEEINHV